LLRGDVRDVYSKKPLPGAGEGLSDEPEIEPPNQAVGCRSKWKFKRRENHRSVHRQERTKTKASLKSI